MLKMVSGRRSKKEYFPTENEMKKLGFDIWTRKVLDFFNMPFGSTSHYSELLISRAK